MIYDVEKFSKMLPKYFKTDNFASFVRQLNMYKFQKLKNPNGFQQFTHPFFKRGFPEDLIKIKRKTANNGRITKQTSKKKNASMEISSKIQERLAKLEKSLKVLTVQNQTLIKSNQRILGRLVENKLSTDHKIKKLLLITHNVTKTTKSKSNGFSPLVTRLESNIKELHKSLNDDHHELTKEFSGCDNINEKAGDTLLNEALDMMYNESNKYNGIETNSCTKAKKDAEDKLLEQLVGTETPGQTPNIRLNTEYPNDYIYNNVLNSERIHSTLFRYDDQRKNEISFNCEEFDFKNSKFSPHLIKPYSIDMSTMGKNILK